MKRLSNPPTKTFTYTVSKRIGFCDKCKQPIYELATLTEEVYDATGPEGYKWLSTYVQNKLLASGVIPKEDANPANPFSITANIVHDAIRCGTHKLPNGKFACIDVADREIEWKIRCPPPPITSKRFSLKAFIKQ